MSLCFTILLTASPLAPPLVQAGVASKFPPDSRPTALAGENYVTGTRLMSEAIACAPHGIAAKPYLAESKL